MNTVQFSVDAALLRELGERLVGQPYIALAELVKNSYDADAHKVEIRFRADRIDVIDNGHGMTSDEFEQQWMRIGSPHKAGQKTSRALNRPLTGSKGVGRLSSQFLGSRLELRSVALDDTASELHALVNWEDAVRAGDLVKATAEYEQIPRATSFPDKSASGTMVSMTGLRHEWVSDDFEALAREIWSLQPPFRTGMSNEADFRVQLVSPDAPQIVDAFRQQMLRFLDLWEARLVGKLIDGESKNHGRTVQLSLEFKGQRRSSIRYTIDECHLDAVEFEIRVYDLRHKQRFGIRVQDAREYFKKYGGVNVYDSGFRVPYYGAETDWLKIEIDHSHRLSRSELLPDELQITEGLNNLPTNSRLFGIVRVNTSQEREAALARSWDLEKDHLAIQVSRDRLVDNKAFGDLVRVVRWGLDYYAMEKTRLALEESLRQAPVQRLAVEADNLDAILNRYEDQLPKPIQDEIRTHVSNVVSSVREQAENTQRQIGLLSALTTAGMMALAYDHEISKQLTILDDLATRLETEQRNPSADASNHAEQIREWLERARKTHALFSYLGDETNRERRGRLRAQAFVRDLANRMDVLLRGIPVEVEIDPSFRLPPGSYAEWASLFQNVLLNAANAVSDADRRRIRVQSFQQNRRMGIHVLDTGIGVDLSKSSELFEPFVRKIQISPEGRRLGFGGSGLGLTIVRMIASELETLVHFVEPPSGFSTCFEVAWTNK